MTIEIKNIEGLEYLKTIENNSINLILTDPPYIISKVRSGDIQHELFKQNENKFIKTNDEWEIYKLKNNITTDDNKDNYLKFGTKYGKRYGVKTDFGEWDRTFTIDMLEEIIIEYYKKLKVGGTLIMFFDIWKMSQLKDILEKHKFKQIRMIEWIKTNPRPLNSKGNYLSNAREIALTCCKIGNPTYNSSYDNGIYTFPSPSGKIRFHPTQKPLLLFEQLIIKHSNENDVVLDTFLGSGTTANACKKTNRHFKGCESNKEYFDKISN